MACFFQVRAFPFCKDLVARLRWSFVSKSIYAPQNMFDVYKFIFKSLYMLKVLYLRVQKTTSTQASIPLLVGDGNLKDRFCHEEKLGLDRGIPDIIPDIRHSLV